MNPINTILLQPTDVLFFRDGRPMEGSLAGHGASWPLPNITDAALHAALHRSGLSGHAHDLMESGERDSTRNRQFGSLVTAGPFPVFLRQTSGPPPVTGTSPGDTGVQSKPGPPGLRFAPQWHFPRPLDLMDHTLVPALLPTNRFDSIHSSLPNSLLYPVANRLPPSKDSVARAWLCVEAYQRYLHGGESKLSDVDTCDDSAFSDAEATVGIFVDSETGTTGQGEAAGRIYSARYLRLRDEWRLGVFAKTEEKNGSPDERLDLIPQLIDEKHQLLVGGQQRLCTAELRKEGSLPLPWGKQGGFVEHAGKWLVKWILLSPAIWPRIPEVSKDGRAMIPHPGGWLPNWVRQSDRQVMLRSGQRQRRSYGGKHTRGFNSTAAQIEAKLVAAIVPKPIPVTGWALANETNRQRGGAKSTHLAVPAGAVYYFEADSPEAATQLAAALNWHGKLGPDEAPPATIKNRRSTLMGEKGFGLGVCGTWEFFPGSQAL